MRISTVCDFDRCILQDKVCVGRGCFFISEICQGHWSLKMSVVFFCLKNCFDGTGLSQNNITRREVNPIVLDTGHMGKLCYV